MRTGKPKRVLLVLSEHRGGWQVQTLRYEARGLVEHTIKSIGHERSVARGQLDARAIEFRRLGYPVETRGV